MPLFHVYALDKAGSRATRQANRADHLAHLSELKAKNRLVVAGPLTNTDGDLIGSVLIMEFDSEAELTAWLQVDAYGTAGLYESVTITPFINAMPVID